ncbi:substrate-binding domain-containing protein [Gloeobacter morelensis]|uniref:Substrate-binding domain-containing protein n=1 Tax=Gloeobacter morelensis MG652769 TaxID=2781736 RepID=A0ABY3PKM0_9CYAN|nr:substrate-binding domain-containing protein [Gloeobacter morelensis]UFP94083.1 substrate-binding domain-containing protein [Gloeobacter morelensis MG652769]
MPPPVTGVPLIDSPSVLQWPADNPPSLATLAEPTANRSFDFHASIDRCDMVLVSSGNYHMALRELWFDVYLKKYVPGLKNWYYTTSPPLAPALIQSGYLSVDNLAARCRPQVVVGPASEIDALAALGAAEGPRLPLHTSRGNVILVKKGNPKAIRTVWDLGRADIRVVTPNPKTEQGTFANYSGSIYDIAAGDPAPPKGANARQLYNAIFNNGEIKNKWLSGSRIHHREIPWSIAHGQADAGVIFYHLAFYLAQSFPELFEIVPLGGTVDKPQPLPGNRTATLYATRVGGDWNAVQLNAREKLIEAFSSEDFTQILQKYGLRRP